MLIVLIFIITFFISNIMLDTQIIKKSKGSFNFYFQQYFYIETHENT